jgi:Putative zinc-finger
MSTDDTFTARLSDYLDGEDMDARERAAIETHLAGCAGCRAALEELRGVAAAAASLADTAPATDLWPGISARIETGRPTVPVVSAPRRFSFTLPQLVAAGLALMVLSGGLVWVARLGDARTSIPPVVASGEPSEEAGRVEPANFADAHFDEAVSDLEKTLAAGRNTLDPETVRIIEENLLAIDQAIEQSRRALRTDPANVYLNTHFAAARSRKLALLRRASALAMARNESGG